MKLILQRDIGTNKKVTFGKLYLEGVRNQPDIYTLELPRGNGNKGFCITQGIYNCVWHNSVKHPETWKLLNVPNRTNILIHIGNYLKDTTGCILVGFDIDENVPMVKNSGSAMEYLRNTIGLANNFSIEVKD